MKQIDPQLEPWVGPEASVTIVGSLLVAYVLFWIGSKLVFGGGGGGTSMAGGKAIQDDDDDHDQDVLLQGNHNHSEIPCDGTIVLCGPSLSGKTTLFYHLLHPNLMKSNSNNIIQTVKSIKSNTGFLSIPASSANSSSPSSTWRLVDTPGQWGPEKLLQAISLAQQQQVQQRVVLVIDSTQPVPLAADYLQAVYLALVQTQPQARGGKNAKMAPQILIACHKSQHPKAKNMRRLKLQLRSELERLQKFPSKNDDDKKNEVSSATINWEQVLNDDVLFCSSDIQHNNLRLQDVEQFCRAGTLASSNITTKK